MPNVKRTPLRTPMDSGRRPIRPIDREKMRPWLERHLNNNTAPGVRWVDKDKKTFEIPWRHAARQGWSIEKDACIFESWASHTKKYIEGKDKEKDPKRWKANFRCALNSLPDVMRMPGCQSRGSNAVRRYRFLTPDECKAKNKAKKQRRRRSRYDEDDDTEEEMEEVEEHQDQLKDDTVPSPTAIPNFDQLLADSDVVSERAVSTGHMSGCRVIQCCPSPQERGLSPHNSEASDTDSSNMSDEEVIEAAWQIQEEHELKNYHPNLWSELEFGDGMCLGETVELETAEIVIDITPRAEYWDVTNPDKVFI